MVKDWDSIREELRQLYYIDKKPLHEVMRLVKGKHGFIASERAYRTQLQKWGYIKYSTQKFPNPARKPRPARRSDATPTAAQATYNLGRPIISSTDAMALSSVASAFGDVEPNPQMMHLHPSTIVPLNNSHPNPDCHLPPPSGYIAGAAVGYPNDGKTPLHHAVIAWDKDQVRDMLFAHAAVNVKDSLGNDPLHYAAQNGCLDIVTLLLRFGADVHAKGERGRTPLHLAIRYIDVIKALLKDGAPVSCQDTNGDTPFHRVFLLTELTIHEQFLIMDVLLDHNCDHNIKNNSGKTPFLQLLHESLYYSEGNSLLRCLSRMLHEGADVMHSSMVERSPFEVFLSNAEKNNYFHRYCKFQDEVIETMESFLQRGASSFTPMPDGTSLATYCLYDLFKYTACYGFTNKMARILCTLARPDKVTNGTSLLHELSAARAIGKLPVELAQILLQNGADPNSKNGDGKTPLLLAVGVRRCLKEDVNLVLALMAKGADPWLSDPAGNCALFEAFRTFVKTRAAVITQMLAMDVGNKEKSSNGAFEGESIRTMTEQWPGWAGALAARSWKQGRLALQDYDDTHPADIDKDELSQIALTVLAERHLQPAKGLSFASPEQELGRVLEILRDCRALGIVLHRKYYERLVDLCP